MIIRRAAVEDAERISRLLRELTVRYVLPDISEAGGRYYLAELASDRMRRRLESDFVFHVAESGDDLAGVVAMSSPTHVYYLYVDTRFQRQGLARRLLIEATTGWRASGGEQPLTVSSSPYAVAVYRRLGFQATGGRQEKNGVAYLPMQLTRPDALAARTE